MIAAPVQCDVDGIPKRLHCVRVRSQPEHMIHQEAVTKFHDERVILQTAPPTGLVHLRLDKAQPSTQGGNDCPMA